MQTPTAESRNWQAVSFYILETSPLGETELAESCTSVMFTAVTGVKQLAAQVNLRE